jgi:type II secretory pathway pseudopilin PulG
MNGRSAGEAADLRKRQGFSLLEVILATAMLMGSAVVLSRLAGMGREQSQAARTQDALQGVCERTLNELLLGLRPLIPAEDQPLLPVEPSVGQPVEPIVETPVGRFAVPGAQSTASRQDAAGSALDASPDLSTEPAPEWRFSIRTQSQPAFPGMWTLTVEVSQGDQQLPRRRRFSLTRWISGPPPAGAFEDPRWQQSFDGQLPDSNGLSSEGGLP